MNLRLNLKLNVEGMELQALKALAYDLIEEKEINQIKLNIVNEEIAKRREMSRPPGIIQSDLTKTEP
jgi:hypothetical protein